MIDIIMLLYAYIHILVNIDHELSNPAGDHEVIQYHTVYYFIDVYFDQN